MKEGLNREDWRAEAANSNWRDSPTLGGEDKGWLGLMKDRESTGRVLSGAVWGKLHLVNQNIHLPRSLGGAIYMVWFSNPEMGVSNQGGRWYIHRWEKMVKMFHVENLSNNVCQIKSASPGSYVCEMIPKQ